MMIDLLFDEKLQDAEEAAPAELVSGIGCSRTVV